MKKILSLGAAAAVLSLTAVAASAAIAPEFTGTPVAGETVTVQIVANGVTTTGTQFTVDASDNLTLVESEVSCPANTFASFNETTMIYAWAGTEAPADGTVFLTLTFTVDAAADEKVSVTLVPGEGIADVDAAVVEMDVVAGATEVTGVTESATAGATETAPVTESATGVVTESATASESATATETGTENVPTGVALAVVPAVVAGAAIVVAKKRK